MKDEEKSGRPFPGKPRTQSLRLSTVPFPGAGASVTAGAELCAATIAAGDGRAPALGWGGVVFVYRLTGRRISRHAQGHGEALSRPPVAGTS